MTAINFTSASSTPATAGTIRLANTNVIDWRNFANSGNLPLGVNASDQLTFNGVVLSTAATGGTVSAGTAGRLTLYPATGNTVDDVYVQNSQNIDVLVAAQAARSVALEYTIPNPGNAVATATFALLELAQTFTAIQTFAATVNITSTTNQLILGTTNTVTITSPAPAASRVYTIPDVLGAASFVMTAGAQSIAGVKTFTGGAAAITLSGSTLAMGTGAITGSGSITFSPTTTGLVGTTTNNDAASGIVGEFMGVTGGATNFPATTQVGDLGSLALGAGDWDISMSVENTPNGATVTTWGIGISTTVGNSSAGLVNGDNAFTSCIPPTAAYNAQAHITRYRVSLASPTTYYAKIMATYTIATPLHRGFMRARRPR